MKAPLKGEVGEPGRIFKEERRDGCVNGSIVKQHLVSGVEMSGIQKDTFLYRRPKAHAMPLQSTNLFASIES